MAEQKAKVVHGPGPRGMGGPRPKVENPGKLLKRIMAEVFQHYLPHCILVLICIVVSALANVQASLFLQTLIDDYIIPMTQQQDPSFAPLAGALVRVGCIYVVGILAAWLNARIMVNVTQGTLRNLRTQLFTTATSCPSTPTTWIPCARCSARASRSWCPAPSPSFPSLPACAC